MLLCNTLRINRLADACVWTPMSCANRALFQLVIDNGINVTVETDPITC